MRGHCTKSLNDKGKAKKPFPIIGSWIRTMPLCTLLTVLFFSLSAVAQRKPVNVSQVDPRFTVSVYHFYSSLGEHDELYYYVKNNTADEYKMVIQVTTDMACEGTKTYPLGINKIVYLKPNGSFTPNDDWVHITMIGGENNKKCRIKEGDSYTFLKRISYTISNVTNITLEKAAAEKKKADDAAKKAQEEAAAKKMKEENMAKKALADEATKKAQAEASAKSKQTKEEPSTAKKAVAATGGTGTATAAATKTASSTASTSVASTANLQAEKKQQEAEARAQAERKEAERRRLEDDAGIARQQEYDEWKAAKKDQQNQMELASAAASFNMLYLVGGMIYEGMGNVNPDFVFKPGNHLRFHFGIDFGLSGMSYPSIFGSELSTMTNGKTSTTKELIPKDLYHVNLNVKAKMGAEHPLYGFYGYVSSQAGFSPVFDGYNFSPLNGGGQVFAGIKWVKGFVEYGVGTRFFSSSSNDTEEAGSGTTDIGYERLTYGIKFTTNADANFRRSHVLLGLMDEKISVRSKQAFMDPTSGSLVKRGKSNSIKGYTFQWKKDHNFNLYVNAYPDYLYAGDNETITGPSVGFASKTGLFLEIGFLRSIDFW